MRPLRSIKTLQTLRPVLAGATVLSVALAAGVNVVGAEPGTPPVQTATPIKHVVVIFQENVSFDHYFATYPQATNPPGEPAFHAKPGTPSVDGLSPYLLSHNPNAVQPFRLDPLHPSQVVTCDNNHGYTAEQQAADLGLMDQFVAATGCGQSPTGVPGGEVMGYYDGNTVTALWNYAQNFALADQSFDTTFGPSTPGALNLVSGELHGATVYPAPYPAPATGGVTTDTNSKTGLAAHVLNGTLFNDINPYYDACSSGPSVAMSGQNIGNLLSAKGITWGWFEGGFTPTNQPGQPTKCGSSHKNYTGQTVTDYIPHHEPFQYYKSTANPDHLPPTSTAMIGHQGDQANHQYGLRSFWAAADAGNLPAVSFLKAAGYQDGHPGYSDPLDEQTFLVDTINRLEKLPTWNSTAVLITWDDSDGWYDHVMPPIVSQSNSQVDALTGQGQCGKAASGAYETRCGYGPRIPVLAISPYARTNFVDNQPMASQASILRFIENNWHLGRIDPQSFDQKTPSVASMFDFAAGPRAPRLFLSPQNGQPVGHQGGPNRP